MIILAGSIPSGSMMIDRLVVDVFYQYMLGGSPVIEPEYILRKVSDVSMFPFKINDKVAQSSREMEKTTRPDKMVKNDIYYAFLSNMGFLSFIFGIVCVINILIEVGHLSWNKKIGDGSITSTRTITLTGEKSIPKEYLSNNLEETTEVIGDIKRITLVRKTKWKKRMDTLMNILKSNFGLRYLLIKMMGIQLEVVSYSYLNIAHLDDNVWMIIGFIFSICALFVYGVIGFYLAKGGLKGYRIVCKDQEVNNGGEKKIESSSM